ncbi:hypothetical protein JL107_03320 [Nakamurella flavida]|uniref:Uncharacterized protein n=1 Tax=Nakamurella flavida TaxID=363630 RepID=A0A938YL83_9ACTN|nr:hypothetical protein [Nakamurella flavida]MBM9475467.1 hypothetical protein [Nakamurella flavida]MDP9777025.1 hypothetical protein [Nakamurella flavida]
MAGATEAGDDFSVGRTNSSEERSLLVAVGGDPDGYQTDFVLSVSTQDDKVLTKNPSGVDAIHATGTVALPTGGAIGTIPPGNGVVGRGANGLVGYQEGAARDTATEQGVHAGVLGVGGASPGVFGTGTSGVLGYSDGQPRQEFWESQALSGVAGVGSDVGVRGYSEGTAGVAGASTDGHGVDGHSTLGNGVNGTSERGVGVRGRSETGLGVLGESAEDVGGMFLSKESAQVWLYPGSIGAVNSASSYTPEAIAVRDRGPGLPARGRVGELFAARDDSGDGSLWFCVQDAGPARWAQVLLGMPFDGTT